MKEEEKSWVETCRDGCVQVSSRLRWWEGILLYLWSVRVGAQSPSPAQPRWTNLEQNLYNILIQPISKTRSYMIIASELHANDAC
jgi:hypothetical protein